MTVEEKLAEIEAWIKKQTVSVDLRCGWDLDENGPPGAWWADIKCVNIPWEWEGGTGPTLVEALLALEVPKN